MAETHDNLAAQALSNLVNQFARPLDFLRELVQNSIDASSPRIEVSIAWDPPKPGESLGVTRIHVDDWGEGMDEGIIDNQLTRLFASAKEGDLTKIGKFGIGFTSIFAILPEAILLRTGRHGENWELLFHRDRSFDKVRIQEPVDGTKITLFKRMARDQVDRFVEEARFILTYWCEHSNVPVVFWDKTHGTVVEAVDTDDPFAAFESESTSPTGPAPEPVNRPLEVEADLSVRVRTEAVEAVVGVASQPLYGYYNGGLTLLRTRNTDALGVYEDRTRHLVFKVKSDHLEHTLTRDNVLQDVHWRAAMDVVLEARTKLVGELITRLGQALEAGEDPSVWQDHLARLAEEADVRDALLDASDKPMFRGTLGGAVTLGAAVRAGRSHGGVLVATGDDALTRGLAAMKVVTVDDTPAARALILATEPPPLFGILRQGRAIRKATEIYVVPELLEPADLDDAERKLVANVEELLRKSVRTILSFSVRVGDFGGPEVGATEALVLNGNASTGVFQRPSKGLWAWLPLILQSRCMLINRQHPLFRAQLLASTEHPWLAAAGLAMAVMHVEDLESEASYRALLAIAHARVEAA